MAAPVEAAVDAAVAATAVESVGVEAVGVEATAVPRARAAEPPVLHPLAGRHVVVVGINYAPEPTGIAPYTTGLVSHLAAHAAAVTVLTGVPHYPGWRVPAPYRQRLRFLEQVVRPHRQPVVVHRLRHYVPRRQSAATRAVYEASFWAQLSAMRLRRAPDLVIAVTPAVGGALAASRLARRHGVPLVVVVQDLMARAAGQSGIAGGGLVTGLTARIERAALADAARVAVVSEAFRSQVLAYGVPEARVSVLPNWSHVEPSALSRDEARRALRWPVQPFTLVHTGNVGLKQDLGNLVAAARWCPDAAAVRFVVVGDGSQRAAVEASATGLRNVSFVDPLPDSHYPLALAAADVLVVNERPSVGDMSLPSKLTSYLAAGRPVLAAVSPDGATARELARTGGAALVVPPGEPAALAAAVRELRDDPERRSRMAAAASLYARRELGREAAMRRLDAVVEGAMA
jgi:colanic acid biosynthesis glycosyl transferase WcaI